MAVYDINGQLISGAYGAQGNALTQAYDLSENPLMDGKVRLTVMTFNVQDFTGINSQQAMHQAIIDRYNADIIGFQEFSTNGNTPAVASAVLSEYTRSLSNHKNYLCMAYKTPISNITTADFVSQNPSDMSQWGETRAYMMADIAVGGKTVKWINAHLTLNTAIEYRRPQMSELLTLAEQYERVIITGDFNGAEYTGAEDEEFIEVWKPFFDRGYKCASHKPDGTYTKTYSNAKTASSLSEFVGDGDDIIVSGNIDMEHVWFDDTKLSYPNNNIIDHIPVVARLLI